MRILKTKNVPAVVMIVVIVLFGLSVGKPYAVTLEDLETWVTVDDFWMVGYNSHPTIKMEMAV